MSRLIDTLPRRKLINRFGERLVFQEYGKSDLSTIAKIEPQGLFGLAANVWNRITGRGWHSVNPLQFAAYFKTCNPSLHLAISNSLGVEVIRDIYYVKGWLGQKKRANLVVEMLVAWVYQNDLQLGDITFIDPTRPIPRNEREFDLQTHKGLGLLPALMNNLQAKAEELRCQQLTLTAATRDEVGLFSRHGFIVEDTEVGRIAMKLGFGGIPMERNVGR